MSELRLAAIDVKPGAALESQSGLQMLRPRIWGAWREPAARGRVAAIVMHPASNFMGHYLIAPLAARGVACMGLNSRYAGNDTLLLMERVIQDLGAGVAFLREQGYAKVLLIGNSGGAALSAFYAAQSQQHHRHRVRARRADAPGAGRPAAHRRPGAVRRARGPLAAAVEVDRPGGGRRERPAGHRPVARPLCGPGAAALRRRPSCSALPRRRPRGWRASKPGSTSAWPRCAPPTAPARPPPTRCSRCTAPMPTRAAWT